MTEDGLRLAPFRGLRYVPGKVGSLAAVTSPPYDVVVRPDGLRQLETSDPYNIVRLILPQAGDAAARQAKAAATLRSWREEGVLATDPRPALYVYEQRRGELLQRGLIGALRLSPPEAGIVLPHEDVMPEVVADRARLMRATGANPEPLLLSYRGDGTVTGATAVVERTVLRPPLLATTTEDGFSHRLWAVTDPAELAAVDADLSRHRALIADGHHRWATYLRLREEQARSRSAEGRPPGSSPWDHGLVLLVDTVRHPLRVQAIHRVLPRLPLRRALEAVEASGAFRVRPLGSPDPAEALRILDATPGNAFVLTDGRGSVHLLHDPASSFLDRVLGGPGGTADGAGSGGHAGSAGHADSGGHAGSPGSASSGSGSGGHGSSGHDSPGHGAAVRRPAAWRRLDATVLHLVLLDAVWQLPDRADEIAYLHTPGTAAGKARATGGTAVLMRPVQEEAVRELAERGVMMPRKSTSFGPKPATGLVLRVLDED